MSKPKRVKPCVCAEFGTNGLREHTAGKKTLFALISDSGHMIAACPNHAKNYFNSYAWMPVHPLQPLPQPKLRTPGAKYRFEDLTRKAVREWTARLQLEQGMSRQQAQLEVLAEINRQGR